MRKLRGWVCFGLRGRLNNTARTIRWSGSISRRESITFRGNGCMVVAEQPCSLVVMRLAKWITPLTARLAIVGEPVMNVAHIWHKTTLQRSLHTDVVVPISLTHEQ